LTLSIPFYYQWEVVLCPKSGEFEGARLKFLLNFSATDYPQSPPRVVSLQPVYHPNISAPHVCFNMFESGDGFSSSYTAENYINGLLWLLRNPNFGSILNGECQQSRCGSLWHRNVRKSLSGHVLHGVQYPKLIDDDPEEYFAGIDPDHPIKRPELDADLASKLDFYQTLIDRAASGLTEGEGRHLPGLVAGP
jgi:ubiquitin-protein ligase